jgi:hypothetical protein
MVFIPWIWVTFFARPLQIQSELSGTCGISTESSGLFHVCAAVEVKLLLAAGAIVNKKNGDGWTPPFSAARYGHTDVMKLLLDAGAEVGMDQSRNQETKSRRTAWAAPTRIQFL